MNKEYTKILHVKFNIIDKWNCMRYKKQLEDILGPEYHVTFTDQYTTASHPTASITVINMNDDRNSSMEDLIKRVTKKKEEGEL